MHLQVAANIIHRIIRHPLALAGGVLAMAVFVLLELNVRNDLDIFLAASRDMFAGKAIYQELYFGCYSYFYSPLFASVVFPLTWFPPWAAHLLWLILQIWLIWRIWELLVQSLQAHWFNRSLQALFGMVVLLISLRFLRANLHFAQLTIFILWASLESLALLRKRHPAAAGALLALAINFKILPVVFWPWLAWRREWKALAVSVAMWGILFVLPAAWLGADRHAGLISGWWELVNPAQPRHLFDTEETGFHSLTNIIPVFFLEEDPESRALPVERTLVALSPDSVILLTLLARLGVIVAALYFIGSRPFRKVADKLQAFYETSYLLLAIPLIFPHQQTYAFLLAVPAAAWVIYQLMHRWTATGRPPPEN
jgi:hypothetical protein